MALTQTLTDPGTDAGVRLAVTIGQRLVDRPPGTPHGTGTPAALDVTAGRALLLRALARVDAEAADAWTAHADAALAVLDETTVADVAGPGLLSGAGGAVVALADAAASDPAHLDRLVELQERLADDVLLADPPDLDDLGWGDYDVVSGAAGQLLALVAASRVLPPSPTVRAAAQTIVGGLTATLDGPLPCRVSPTRYLTAWESDAYPDGYVNLGLAHGVPGVVLALATAHRHAVADVDLAALRRAASWVVSRRIPDRDGGAPTWPTSWTGQAADEPDPSRTAWCYGTPGVALALHAAAVATGDDALAAPARAALLARPDGDAVRSGTLCHGWAGLLLCASSVAGDDDALRALADAWALRVTSAATPGAAYAVPDVADDGAVQDDPGLLTGASGVGLALLAHTHPAATATWRTSLGA
ncbi:lanthionine synthetase LanC family protein [Cellulomonas sp. 179-A 9B4 NHS]|uniref:lanthionine synthetase LanC family protein n=1 Tax=Cellulomonas sp. 179-A 9B4 NHS TaxID=3142379 RepID=UPI0039A161D8